MKTFFKILFAPLLWLIHACSPLGEPVNLEKSDNHYYNRKKNDIHYSPRGNWFEVENSPMNADVESFEVQTRFFSRDKNYIYYMKDPVKSGELDFETFHTKNGDFMDDIGFDKNHVYAFQRTYSVDKTFAAFLPIKNANPKTYMRSSYDWAKDDKNHFYRNQPIEVDHSSFENINENFSRDKDSVYVHYYDHFENLKTADVLSFETLNSRFYAMDEQNIFYIHYVNEEDTEILKLDKNSGTATLLEEQFIKIGNQVYFGVSPLDLDSNSIEIFGGVYIKDNSSVYYGDKLLNDADAKSFGSIDQYQIGDKNGVFRAGKRIEKN